jgi:two-component system, chemotaxis family, chemotaxis protein CheY
MKKVLVIDDNAVNRKLAMAMMKKRGWETAEADCGLDGLASLDAVEYDAVLLDISMPGMNGEEVCREIRANDKTKHLRVIAYTAHALESDKARIMSAGFDDILIKPVSMDMLKSKLPD